MKICSLMLLEPEQWSRYINTLEGAGTKNATVLWLWWENKKKIVSQFNTVSSPPLFCWCQDIIGRSWSRDLLSRSLWLVSRRSGASLCWCSPWGHHHRKWSRWPHYPSTPWPASSEKINWYNLAHFDGRTWSKLSIDVIWTVKRLTVRNKDNVQCL